MVQKWLGRRIRIQLFGVVLIVDVVAHANELAVVVRAGQKDDRNTQNFGIGNTGCVGWVGLEDELVDANGNGAYEERVEFLIVLVPG